MMLKMFKSYLVYLVWIVLPLPFIFCENIPGCKHVSRYGMALDDQYHSLNAPNLATCLIACMEDTNGCKSLTYDLFSALCQLSTETELTKPMLLKAKPNSIYMSVIPKNINGNKLQITTKSPPEVMATNGSPSGLAASSTTSQATTGDVLSSVPPTTTTETPESTTTPSKSTQELLTTASPPATTQAPTENSFDAIAFCNGKAIRDHAYPGNCKKYITCSPGNQAHVRECLLSVILGICGSC